MFKFLFFVLSLLLLALSGVSAHPLSHMRRGNEWNAVVARSDYIVPKVVVREAASEGSLGVRSADVSALRARSSMGKRSWQKRYEALSAYEPVA